MAFNLQGAAPLDLTVFGGLVTEMPPENLPAGTSPDNQECIFRPGAVGKRPGLTKVFTTPFGALTVTYAKSYVDNNGVIRNLYLDSSGNLYVENLTASAGAFTLIGSVAPNSYAKSVTAFGREYIAFSDTLHGTDVPLQYDGTNLDRVTQDGPGGPPAVANLLIPATAMSLSGGVSMTRANNVVTVSAAAPHGLLTGYQAQISKVTAQFVGYIASIVINNQDSPGAATVTMAAPHGLGAGAHISIQYVAQAFVANIAQLSREGSVVTCGTATPHGLSAGAFIQIAGAGVASFDSQFTVAAVIDASTFTFAQADVDAGAGAAGTVSIIWPQSGPSVDAFWEVITVPSALSFQVQITYPNGTWTDLGAHEAGSVTYPWDGTFYVTSVPTNTTFTYKHNGPNGTTTDIGTITPSGQLAPGQHQMQVLYQTRQGYVTAPSPPVTFIANGGQYLRVTNIPIGPPNVIARILAFTGAEGATFFYIPVAAQVNGIVVSTATQINDNSTTAVTLDFSDNTLYAALGINTMGNQVAQQIVLDSALAFGFYNSRLITHGQRNRILNLLNMGFEGGSFPATATIPTGWTPTLGGGGLAPGRFGMAWNITAGGILSQSFYLDAYGAPIATPNTKYLFRAWLKGTGSLTATISSATSGFTSSVTLTASATGAFVQGAFSATMPLAIPVDMTFKIDGTNVLVDELSVIYTETPFLEKILYGSYVNNPEAFDGVTGKFGAAEDSRKIMNFGIIRSTLFLLTQDPSGRLHAVPSNGVTEPSGWNVEEIGANCGALSAFGLTVSQADDQSGSGGEEWMAWPSSSGVRIFGGNQPWKISQEIQPDWDSMNPAALSTIWALNDPVTRRVYFGLPVGFATSPNLIYPMDYRELDTAEQISASGPIHTSYSGRLVATDHVRKWTRWNLTMNGAALMYRQPGALTPIFFFGNGGFPGLIGGGCGNVYFLCDNKLTDDCFGAIPWYYVTYFFANHDAEQALQLTFGRHMLQYFQYEVAGKAGVLNGHVRVTALVNQLDNPWPLGTLRNIRVNPAYDDEWPGASVTGQRFAFKFESLAGTV